MKGHFFAIGAALALGVLGLGLIARAAWIVMRAVETCL